ncbi:hypothetical protein CEXT_384601 [Caerostris extrusa]|uniref:Uncharacterized protein n=1 Tax=Caerostris extrusa TaxID=172846 RepID=A0AAV4MK74_CAEEX|nr:hypothetical protein CEXT_384601 [Caerostris extrusa]
MECRIGNVGFSVNWGAAGGTDRVGFDLDDLCLNGYDLNVISYHYQRFCMTDYGTVETKINISYQQEQRHQDPFIEL